MNKILFFLIAYFNFSLLYAQENSSIDTTIYKVVEEMPRAYFPKCEQLENSRERKSCADNEILQFIYKNIKYPAISRKNGIHGKVVISFIVEKNISISNEKIIKGDTDIAEQLICLMKDLTWISGKQKGKNVRVQVHFPLNIHLK